MQYSVMEQWHVCYRAPHEVGRLFKPWNAPDRIPQWSKTEAQHVADCLTAKHPDWEAWLEYRDSEGNWIKEPEVMYG